MKHYCNICGSELSEEEDQEREQKKKKYAVVTP